ncbi:MAG: hypothetical protein AMXMBFR12_05160 [Candidatus Babeliales bacterium]
MKKMILTSLFLSISLIAQELPQLPEPPRPVSQVPTSIYEETERVTASIIPEASHSPEIETPTTQSGPATTDLQIPAAPHMETPKPAEELEIQDKNSINIGLSSEVRQKVATLLNKLLSDEYVLYTKTLKFHWNVKGIGFNDFHKAFKTQYENLFDMVDAVAERARAMDNPAAGSLKEFSTLTRLQEINGHNLTALEMVKQLLADHEAVIRTIRADIDQTAQLGDQGTSGFLQELIVKHEKIAWMLRATAAQ